MHSNPEEKELWNNHKVTHADNAYLGLTIGDKFINLGRGACHGGFQIYNVSSFKRKYPGELKVLWSKLMPLQEVASEKLAKTYYNWLLNDSPFADAFIEKDYEVCKKQGFSLTPDLPAHYVAAAAVATRFLTENHSGTSSWVIKRIPLYEKLLEQGMDLLWAFLMANLYQPTGSKASYSPISGHEMIPSTLGLKSLKRFVIKDYRSAPTFAQNNGYATISTAWVNPSEKDESLAQIAKNLVFDNKEVKDLNLFRKPDKSGGYPLIPITDLQKVVEKFKELINDKKAA